MRIESFWNSLCNYMSLGFVGWSVAIMLEILGMVHEMCKNGLCGNIRKVLGYFLAVFRPLKRKYL